MSLFREWSHRQSAISAFMILANIPGVYGLLCPGPPSTFGMFLMRPDCLTLPDELMEATCIDGAGRAFSCTSQCPG